MEAVSRFEVFVAGSVQDARQSRVCTSRSYQIKATIAAGVPVFESWKRGSIFRRGGGACGPALLVLFPPRKFRFDAVDPVVVLRHFSQYNSLSRRRLNLQCW